MKAARHRAAVRGRILAVSLGVPTTDANESAEVEVVPSNAEPACFAALLLRPELAGTLLEPTLSQP